MAEDTGESVDQVDDVQPDADAQGGGAPDAAAQTLHRVVFNGKEEQWPLEKIIRTAQVNESGQRKLQEAAQMRKATAEMEEKFGKDPVAVMVAKFGPEKAKEMMENKLYEIYQRGKESPEQREAREAKEELARLKTERQQLVEQQERQRQQALENHFADKWNREFTDAIKTSGLEHNAFNVGRMSELALLALDNDLDVNPVDIAKMVKDETEAKMRTLAKSLSAEQLIQYLGDETVEQIRKTNLTKLKQSPVQRRPGTAPKTRTASREPVVLSKEEKWERYKERLAKEGK